MNNHKLHNYSKEIQDDLNKLCLKYNIKRGIFLFEETNKSKLHKNIFRVILINPAVLKNTVTVFATLLFNCIKASSNLQKIENKMTEIAIMESIKDLQIHNDLLHQKKDKIKN